MTIESEEVTTEGLLRRVVVRQRVRSKDGERSRGERVLKVDLLRVPDGSEVEATAVRDWPQPGEKVRQSWSGPAELDGKTVEMKVFFVAKN